MESSSESSEIQSLGQMLHEAEVVISRCNWRQTVTQEWIERLAYESEFETEIFVKDHVPIAERMHKDAIDDQKEAQEKLYRIKEALRQKRSLEEQEKISTRKHRRKFVPQPCSENYKSRLDAWKAEVDGLLQSSGTIRTFPEPPAVECESRACLTTASGWSLSVCRCAVRKAFSTYLFPAGLKLERLKWHPDRFSTCAPGIRAEVQAKAAEVFIIVNDKYNRSNAK